MSNLKRINLKPPPSRPNALNALPPAIIDSYKIDRKKYPVVLLGVRGYFLNNQGKKGVNDRNLYDDAIFVDIRLSNKSVCYSFNANTDPGYINQGKGNTKGKGMFVLDTGVYYAHRLGKHHGKSSSYEALAQWDSGDKKYDKSINEGKVRGHRDGGDGKENKPYPVGWGHYSINIHKGGVGKNQWTWSEGCQTIPRTQWNEFINLITKEMKVAFPKNYKRRTIPYCLLDNEGHKKKLNSLNGVKLTPAENKVAKAMAAVKKAAAAATAAKKAATEASAAARKAATAETAAKKKAAASTSAVKKATAALAKAKKEASEAKKKAATVKKKMTVNKKASSTKGNSRKRKRK